MADTLITLSPEQFNSLRFALYPMKWFKVIELDAKSRRRVMLKPFNVMEATIEFIPANPHKFNTK